MLRLQKRATNELRRPGVKTANGLKTGLLMGLGKRMFLYSTRSAYGSCLGRRLVRIRDLHELGADAVVL